MTVDYERVIRYNYKQEEKFALIEFIAMLKGVSSLLLREDGVLTPIVHSCVHDELQEFIQVGLREAIRSVTSKKKKEMRTELMQLRALAGDWLNGIEPVNDPALSGQKSKEPFKVQIPTRQVGPSPTQLELVRSLVFSILFLKRKEISSKHVKIFEDFYARSFFFPYLLNLSNTVVQACDLGDLWWRSRILLGIIQPTTISN